MSDRDASLELVAHAAGRLVGATAMAAPPTRRAAMLRRLSDVWDAYLRDAGAGDVGREHQAALSGLFATADPRRDALILWLIDYAGPAVAECAAQVAAAVGARHQFDPDTLDRLAIALDLMPKAPDRLSAADTLQWLWAYVERLRHELDFAETVGEMFEIAVATKRLSTYRSAMPGACWAANLALVARAPASLLSLPPATLSRLLFRLDLGRDEQVRALTTDWLHGIERSDANLWETDRELRRGLESLASLSKNARARDAWALIVGTGGVTRAQLTRALGLSRGGTGLVVQQLVDAGLVRSGGQGLLVPADSSERAAAPLDDGLKDAASAVDQAMAEIDRLLARSASSSFRAGSVP